MRMVMSCKFKKLTAIALAAGLVLTMAACSTGSGSSSTQTTTSVQNLSTDGSAALDTSDMFTDRDLDPSYDESTAVKISLADGASKSSDSSVKISSNTITISKEGVYVLSGSLSDGQIIVAAGDNDKIQLVLDGVSITNDSSAPIYVKSGDKVFVTLAENSRNTLSVTGEYQATDDNNVDSAIFSKSDLTLNGSGALTVNAAYGHGIVGKDDLVIAGGSYNITSASKGISANDSIRIASGSITVKSGTDGLHAENTDDESLGFIYVKTASLSINAGYGAIDASSTVMIDDGTFKLISGSGSANASKKADGFFGSGKFKQSDTQTDDTSLKGIKADGNIIIADGSFDIDSADDAIHSNSDTVIKGGTFAIKSGDDGIHSNSGTVISGGEIVISDSYEGIEGQTIDISGGSISVTASDDGLNAAGGNDSSQSGGMMQNDMFATDENAYIKISGGELNVNSSGDGVDSNGNLYVSGGETYVSGPTDSGNGALDYNGTAEITGGIFIATGMSGMAQNFSDSSTQGSILYNSSTQSTETIVLKDSSGNTIATFSPNKSYNSVVISTPDIKDGETYSLTMAGQTVSIEMSGLIYGNSSGMQGGMGGMQGGMGGGPDGMQGGMGGKGMR